ncbi:caskin-2-like [Centruroides sculpturatus]|uniref:caskin-2-like n=1 Tax=Centruroides sculpturatus TaxID=218467 RepID=UPI000C6DDCB0|nr:caskin-2-like [Centruroides sculpturatus]
MFATMGKEQELFHAIKTEDIQGLSRLLSKYRSTKPKLLGSGKRFNINIQDNDGMAGLHQAALMCSVPILQLLLDSGAQVDIKDNKGMRPLHYAAWQGKPEAVAVLLQYNASVNDQACKGETPLHFACQHGHLEVTKKLLQYHANPTIRNKEHKTALDVACEFGRYQVIELLLQSNRCRFLLEEHCQDMEDNNRTTCLHLAARNGHVDVIRLLVKYGVDINRCTLRGTALHEAAMHGKLDVVRLLIECGIDVNKPNSYDQTALDIVRSFTSCQAEKEMKQLLKEIISAVEARAIRDFDDPADSECLALKEGDIVNVLEQSSDGRWKGIIFNPNRTSRTGYFPATAVQLLNRPVGGMQRTATLKSSTIKKVTPPIAPDLTNRHSGSSFSSGYGSQATVDRNSCGSLSADDAFSPAPGSPPADDYPKYPGSCATLSSPNRPHFCFPDGQTQYAEVIVHPQPDSTPGTPTHEVPHPLGTSTTRHHKLHVTHALLEDQGIDVGPCPGRDSPGGSSGSSTSGSRHSTSSLDSGRASGSDVKVPCRLSGHSYESTPRHSCYSSNSSLGSVDRVTEDGHTSSSSTPAVNVAEMVLHGIPDVDVLTAWLTSLHFEEYVHLFLQAGYDMPTISRMTPEDLTAIGITKPNHRRKLKAEIAKLNISDGIPDYKPDCLLEWLQLLQLEEYYETLCRQGYDTVDRVNELTWEDLEEIGIQKLGHQKKMVLAIKRIRDMDKDTRRRNLDLPVKSVATLPRPTLVNQCPLPNFHFQGQEVAITTLRAKSSPSIETGSIPEMKTFQQSPPKEDCFAKYMTGELPSPLCTHVINQQVQSSGRGRSLESLDMDDSISTVMAHPYSNNTDSWYDTINSWRQCGYDTDSEFGMHSTGNYQLYETDGTASLHRPRGLVKPRPVAKIIAKSRSVDVEVESPPEIFTETESFKSINSDNSWLTGSPQHTSLVSSVINNSVDPYGSLRGKKIPPPPPPKRTNSIKSNDDSCLERSLEEMKDEAFATCVKGLASHFSMTTNDFSPPSGDRDRPSSPIDSEDFPPPPSPLPSIISELAANDDRIGAKDDVQLRELHANFRQRRKDSADSNISTSSTESNSLPFANENVGTIKQRAAKAHPALMMEEAVSTAALHVQGNSTGKMLGKGQDGYSAEKDMKQIKPNLTTSGDVIDDIENMLANLSNQLDAMLEDGMNDE